jgi:transcriptional regulator with XRE-family HTH domain
VVRVLRSRMGWSRAEIARVLKVDLEQIQLWENRESMPSDAISEQLKVLMNQADSQSDKVQSQPIADRLMSRNGLNQVHRDEVVEYIENSMTAVVQVPLSR